MIYNFVFPTYFVNRPPPDIPYKESYIKNNVFLMPFPYKESSNNNLEWFL